MRTLLKPTLTFFLRPLLAGAIGAALLAGCSSTSSAPRNALFDFGPASVSAPAERPSIGAVVVTDVTGSSVFDNERMYYRLNYADPLQARAYNDSRWGSTPLQMVTQRLKSRIAQTGAL